MRKDRSTNELRTIEAIPHFSPNAEGSCFIKFGNTHVLCNASVDQNLPRWLKGKDQGWITAEYGMLPRSTPDRIIREASKGKQSGRTQEIQRLIGRSLRSIIDLKKLGEITIQIDCDVIQADGGTRTASITGAYVALHDAIQNIIIKGIIKDSPIIDSIAAISLGVKDSDILLDLDYAEDSTCDTDMNIVMTGSGKFVEIQGTAEGVAFTRDEMNNLIDMAEQGIKQLTVIQNSLILLD